MVGVEVWSEEEGCWGGRKWVFLVYAPREGFFGWQLPVLGREGADLRWVLYGFLLLLACLAFYALGVPYEYVYL